MAKNGPWGDRVPTREEAIARAASVYLDARIRMETERLVAAAQEDAPVDGQVDEGEDPTP